MEVNGKNIEKMYQCATKKNKNLHKGCKTRAKIRYFEIDHSVPHSCYVNKKVAEKGYIQPDIGPEWRKVAEVG